MAHLQKNIVLLLAVLAIAAGPVTARADPSADAKAEAKKHYDRAMELNEDGQVAAAIIELKRCYGIAPHHTVLYNLGQAYISLSKPVEAVAALQRYLVEGGKAIKPARRAEVEKEIARQTRRIATLDIRGLPDDAVVTIDGEDVGKALLANPVRVGVGRHVVSATAAGYVAAEAKIEVSGEDSKVVELKLVAQAGEPSLPVPVVAGAGPGEPRPAPPAVPIPAAVAPQAVALEAASNPAMAAPSVASTPPATPDTATNAATAKQMPPGLNLAPAQGEVAASADGSKARNLRIAGLVTGGVGVVSLLTGVILWEAATATNDHAVSELSTNPAQAHTDRNVAENLATGANVCLIAGGVLVGAGAIATWISFDIDAPSKSMAIAPAVGPNFAGLTAKGVW